MSVAERTASRPAADFRVTRSRRNVAWTGAVALAVVVVLAMFPYIVYSGTTTILVQAFIVLTADQTIANIHRRRLERNRNVGRPLKDRRIRTNHTAIMRLADRLPTENWRVVRLAFRDDLYEQLHDLLVDGGWACDRHPVAWGYDWERRLRVRVRAA